MNTEKIVITGYGIKVPGAGYRNEFLDMLKEGRHAIQPYTEKTQSGKQVFVGLVTDALDEVSDRTFRRYPRLAKLVAASTVQALEMAGIEEFDSARAGIFVANSTGNPQAILESHDLFNAGNAHKLPIETLAKANIHTAASGLAVMLKHHGVTRTVSTGCTASLDAIEDAMAYMLSGKLDMAIIGGTEASMTTLGIEAFAKTSLSHDQGLDLAGSPFSDGSNGFIWSEGAGTLVLETESHALRRNAQIYGVVDTVCSNNDAYSIILPDRTGNAMQSVVAQTLNKRTPDYINSQALGAQDNDRIEEAWMQDIFEHSVPVTSIKGHIGHPHGATGTIQVISSVLTMEESFVFKTIRTDKHGYEDVNLVLDNIYMPVNEVLISNHGLGGNNSCLYLKKYE